VKIQLPYGPAANLAERIKTALAPGCSRIEIADARGGRFVGEIL
jgi:hypothetical protein